METFSVSGEALSLPSLFDGFFVGSSSELLSFFLLFLVGFPLSTLGDFLERRFFLGGDLDPEDELPDDEDDDGLLLFGGGLFLGGLLLRGEGLRLLGEGLLLRGLHLRLLGEGLLRRGLLLLGD